MMYMIKDTKPLKKREGIITFFFPVNNQYNTTIGDQQRQ